MSKKNNQTEKIFIAINLFLFVLQFSLIAYAESVTITRGGKIAYQEYIPEAFNPGKITSLQRSFEFT